MLPIGTLIEKCNSGPGHLHKDGSRGQITAIARGTGRYSGTTKDVTETGYLVRWSGESEKLMPQFVPEHMLRPIEQ